MKCQLCEEELAEICRECHKKDDIIRAGHLLHDAWSTKTQGVNQCVKCGIRILTPADENKIPLGWKKTNQKYFDRELIARWNIWLGVCPDCKEDE